MGGTAAMAPCVALAPRRDGMPSPGTSGGIGGRPHVALRQPLPRYARRPISPNRVRPGDLGGFSVVRSAPVGEGGPSEEDAPRRDEARGDRTGSIARLPRVSRRAGGGARLVAARRSPSPDRARARSVRLRCLPPSSSSDGVSAGDDADAEDGGASGSSETASDDVAEANDADTDGGASDDAGEEKAGRDDESDTTDAAVDPIPLVIKAAAADDDDDDDASDVEDDDDQVVTDPPVEEVLDRRSKVMAAAEANVPPSQRDPKAQSTEEALAEEAEALAEEEALDEAAAQSATEDATVEEETLSISRETRNEFAESGSFDEAERAELDTASETSPVSDSSDDSIDDSIDPDTNPNGSGDDVKVTEGVDYAGTVTAEYTFPSSLQGKPRDDAAERFKKAFQKKDKKVGEQEEALREAFSQYADDMEDIDAEAPASATSSIAQFDPADNDEYTPRAISRVCFFLFFLLAIRLNACFVPYRPFPIKTPSWCSPRSAPSP